MRKIAYPKAITVTIARKVQSTMLPKKILFPSRSEIGIILKNAKRMFILANKGAFRRYPTIAKMRFMATPPAAIRPTWNSETSEKLYNPNLFAALCTFDFISNINEPNQTKVPTLIAVITKGRRIPI